jgi:hypothetical protein
VSLFKPPVKALNTLNRVNALCVKWCKDLEIHVRDRAVKEDKDATNVLAVWKERVVAQGKELWRPRCVCFDGTSSLHPNPFISHLEPEISHATQPSLSSALPRPLSPATSVRLLPTAVPAATALCVFACDNDAVQAAAIAAEDEVAMADRCTAAVEASGERRVAATHVKLAEASDWVLNHTREKAAAARAADQALLTLRAQATQVRLRESDRGTKTERGVGQDSEPYAREGGGSTRGGPGAADTARKGDAGAVEREREREGQRQRERDRWSPSPSWRQRSRRHDVGGERCSIDRTACGRR